MNADYNVPPHLQRLIDAGITGLEIMHGELKNLMLIAEQNLEAARENEPLEENEHHESDDYHYGYLDALSELYNLTYQLSFAIGAQDD
jgi:hypothetical protein